MDTKLLLAGALLAGSALLDGTAARAHDLTVVSWGGSYQDAQRKIYFSPFAEKTAKPLLDEAWDGGIGVLQAKVKAGTPNWDVVNIEAADLSLGCDDGLLEKLDWAKLGGKERYLPAAVSDCGIGANVWSTAIAFDGAKLAAGPKSWADFWDTARFPGKRALRKGPQYNLEFALMADGVKKEDVYTTLSTSQGVDRAFKKLDALKPSLVWWESGAQPLQLLASGEVAMTTAYNGRITGIDRTEKRDFKVVWPGSMYSIDSWAILKGAENTAAAMNFIAFASEAANQAKLPAYVAYGLPNKEAAALVPSEYKADLPTNPDNMKDALAFNANFWIDNSEALTQRFNAWLAQ